MHSSFSEADTAPSKASGAQSSSEASSSARLEVSHPEASPLTSFPAPSTAQIQETASVEPAQSVPRAEDTPAPQQDSGYAHTDPDEVSATPAQAGSGSTSNTNPQETESPSGSFPDASRSRLTSLPAPSTARAPKSAPAEPTLSAPMSEDAPALHEDPGPARADPDEVSETPAPVGSGVTSNANPQETESPSTEVSLTPQCAVEHSSSIADISE